MRYLLILFPFILNVYQPHFKNEKLTKQQKQLLLLWKVPIPKDGKVKNIYFNNKIELEKSFIVYNEKDNVSQDEYGSYKVLFYKNNSHLIIDANNGNALSVSLTIINLKNNVKYVRHLRLIKGNYIPTVKFHNINGEEIDKKTLSAETIADFNLIENKSDIIFNDFS